jgi:hypothetical protein
MPLYSLITHFTIFPHNNNKNAFDRVPHSWIIKSVELIGINNKVISFTKKAMPHWRTRMCLRAEQKLIKTEDI